MGLDVRSARPIRSGMGLIAYIIGIGVWAIGSALMWLGMFIFVPLLDMWELGWRGRVLMLIALAIGWQLGSYIISLF